MEPHDSAASKLAAGLEKDLDWLEALLCLRLVTPALLRERAAALPFAEESARELILARLDRLVEGRAA